MDAIPLSALVLALVACLLTSAFFSASETAMMAINRYRLNSHAREGNRLAIRTGLLLKQTDKLLGVILLGNTLINTLSATLCTLITAKLFEGNEFALGIATLLVAFAILVVSEAVPKVLAAAYPQPIAYGVSYPLSFLLKLFYPAVWFVNLFVSGLLNLLRLKRPSGEHTPLSREELRMMVLEAGHFIEKKHHSILVNLFELENISVDDVMVPRHAIEAIDLSAPIAEVRRQLATCHHTRLPVYEGDPDNVLGLLHIRKVLNTSLDDISIERLREVIREPYFIPASTPLFTQMQAFQENHRRIGLVVDEYGELRGLVTLEDILEQMVGEFTSNAPGYSTQIKPQDDGSILVDGKTSLRELNRKLGTPFPLAGPKTLNGLILEYFEDIPDAATCLEISGIRMEILQTQDRNIKSVKLYR
ncbi:HlyC/CorC family transporter [Chitinimonas sp.]|uniref:HlyC/CorC family transporter n=1 Tax=Chitinimonas sp. TaxID=1934313 RepID=UPI0035B413D5